MSVTSLDNLRFVKSDQLLARVKRELRSFNQVGIVDPNDFYEYAMDVLEDLGMAVMLEKNCIKEVKDFKFHLPEGFKYLYSANICTHNGQHTIIRPQNGYVFYTDTLYENVQNDSCKIDCTEERDKFKVTVREYIEEQEEIHNFTIGSRLHEVYSTIDNKIMRHNEIQVAGDFIYTGFESGMVHVKYYSSPIDDNTGLPLIPDNNKIQRAIEYYVISKMFLSWYLNEEVTNIAQKAAEMDKKYREAFQIAMNERKTPGFATLVNYARIQRSKFDTYRSLESYRNY